VPRYVGLLRAVNVGGRNKVPMAALRDLVESLGHSEVSTFIQSGNVVFTASGSVTPKSLETAIAKRFQVDTTVVLRTPSELERVVKANPFAGVDTSKLHVGFMTRKPSAAAVSALDTERFQPEEFAIRARELYLHLPNGMGRSKLPAYLDRQLKIPSTVRNWTTVTKLLELARR
jgi:uncharacterized protein (DUF1697 family)